MRESSSQSERQLLDELLQKTSRTFALSIPRLPRPTRGEVTVAYLLFRIADTFEDAAQWAPELRLRALADFEAVLDAESIDLAREAGERWTAGKPVSHEGYLQLLESFPDVLRAYCGLSTPARMSVREHVVRSARGMAGFVRSSNDRGELRLATLEDLRQYCYVVAGIVGEMLTELFLLGREELQPIAGELRTRTRAFGEGLQLVNILKDASADRSEGRSYLPDSGRGDVFALARSDLSVASEYVLHLQRGGAPRGVVEFTALPVRLAWEALDQVERHGPGSKISRLEVYRITRQLQRALDAGDPAITLPSAAASSGVSFWRKLIPSLR